MFSFSFVNESTANSLVLDTAAVAVGLNASVLCIIPCLMELTLVPTCSNDFFPVSNAFLVSGDVAILVIDLVRDSTSEFVLSFNLVRDSAAKSFVFDRASIAAGLAKAAFSTNSRFIELALAPALCNTLFPVSNAFVVSGEVGIIFLIEPSNEAIKESGLGLVVSELPSSAGVFCVNFSAALFITEPNPLAAF